MSNETIVSKSQKAYKVTQTIFYIFAVPMLILALLSGIIMMNTKLSGGYPNLFGYTAVKFVDNGFYDATSEVNSNYAKDEYGLFYSLTKDQYEIGDLIVYYSSPSDSPPIQGFPYWPTSTLSSNFDGVSANTFSDEELSEISFGIIGNIGYITDTNGTEYTCFSIYSSLDDLENGTDQDTIVLFIDTIGKVVETNPIILSALLYCSSFSSFISFVLIPCIFLLLLQVLSIIFSINYEKDKKSGFKQKIRMEEIKMQEEYGSGPKAPRPVNDRSNLARTIEGFNRNRPARPIPTRPTANNGPQRPMPSQPNTVYANTARPKPVQPNMARPAPAKPVPARPAPTRPAPIRPTPTRPAGPVPARPTGTAPTRPTGPTAPRPAPTGQMPPKPTMPKRPEMPKK